MEGVGLPGRVWGAQGTHELGLSPLACLQADSVTCIRSLGDFKLDGRERLSLALEIRHLEGTSHFLKGSGALCVWEERTVITLLPLRKYNGVGPGTFPVSHQAALMAVRSWLAQCVESRGL